ncbi:YgaP family membrane protein [Leptospira fletcheri]
MTNSKKWHLERLLFLIAGSFSLVGLAVGFFISPWGYALNLLVAVNMILNATVGFCPMAIPLKSFGVKSCDYRLTGEN